MVEYSGASDLPNDTDRHEEDHSWRAPLIAFQVINALQLAVTLWVLACMVAYGTKTNRWRKRAQGSSLNSGFVYTTCTIAVALFIPRLVTTQVLFALPYIENGLSNCELVCDIGNSTHAVSAYASYFFIWLRQRLIFKHPYVEKRVGKYAHLLSRLGIVVITIASIGLLCFYIIPSSYEAKAYGCVHAKKKEGGFFQGTERNIIIAITMFFMQGIMLGLCIYPAVRVKFDDSVGDSGQSRGRSIPRPSTIRRLQMSVAAKKGPKTPIQLSVRRTMISCVVMVVSDIVALVPSVIFLPKGSPAPLRRTLYNIGMFVNVFCMLVTFGFTVRVLTLFCPSCKREKLQTTRAVEWKNLSPHAEGESTTMSKNPEV